MVGLRRGNWAKLGATNRAPCRCGVAWSVRLSPEYSCAVGGNAPAWCKPHARLRVLGEQPLCGVDCEFGAR